LGVWIINDDGYMYLKKHDHEKHVLSLDKHMLDISYLSSTVSYKMLLLPVFCVVFFDLFVFVVWLMPNVTLIFLVGFVLPDH